MTYTLAEENRVLRENFDAAIAVLENRHAALLDRIEGLRNKGHIDAAAQKIATANEVLSLLQQQQDIRAALSTAKQSAQDEQK